MANISSWKSDADCSDSTEECLPLTEINGPRERRHGLRKRPFEKGLFDKNNASPEKSAKKENEICTGSGGTSCLQQQDVEIFQKGFDRIREYRNLLKVRLGSPRQDLHLQRRLQEKEELILKLELRIAELESRKSSKCTCKAKREGEDGEEESGCLSSKEDNLTQVHRLLSCIEKLEKENTDLKLKISILESNEMNLKQAFKKTDIQHARFWSLDTNGQLSLSENNVESLQQQIGEQVKEIESLQLDKESLRKQLLESEVQRMAEEGQFLQQADSLRVKLLEAEIEYVNEQNKFTEYLANTTSVVVIESKACKSLNVKEFPDALDKLQNLKTVHELLKNQVLQFPKLMELTVRDTARKIQEAIQRTDEKNKELVDKYTHELQLRKCYHNQLVELRGNIRVFCRVRPVTKEDGNSESVVDFDPYDDGVIFVNHKGRSQQFQMDKVFHMGISQSQVFEEISSIVRSAIDGFNVCIFAYGQTGSGKTYTMEGPPSDPGVNQRALRFLYEETQNSSWQYQIEASMMEIYNETVRDLLNADTTNNKLEIKMKPEGGLHVPNLVTFPVKSLKKVQEIFEAGQQNRAMATTNMNERSSRSHCLLCITVEGVNLITGSKTYGRLNLVDLAGSERVSKSQADGPRLKEAQNINKSLSYLGDVINALKNKHTHIPFRNSKLTYLLQESLGGNSKTLMILQMSPVEMNINETVCTLTFGQRVRSAELGAATRKVEETNKGTPGRDTPKSVASITPSNRTPNIPKVSTVPVNLNLKLK